MGRRPKLGKLGGFAKQMEAFSRQAKFNLLAVGKLAGILKKRGKTSPQRFVRTKR
jgi:hypothetical protein